MPPRTIALLTPVNQIARQSFQCLRAVFSTGQPARGPDNDLLSILSSSPYPGKAPSAPPVPPRTSFSLRSSSPSSPTPTSTPSYTSSKPSAAAFLRGTIERSKVTGPGSAQRASQPSQADEVVASGKREDMERQLFRRWRVGDAYAPHDLSFQEQKKWKPRKKFLKPGQKVSRQGRDIFDELAIDPVKEYKNFALLADYMNETGRIKRSIETGLRPVNQRRMAKAIRRAIGIGIMPSVHAHPELMPEMVEWRRYWFGQ